MMHQELDINKWNRKEHFYFFSNCEDPYFGVTVQSDITTIYNKSKQLGIPLNTCLIHRILQIMNSIECFRYRIVDEKVLIYNRIDVGLTIPRPDETFCFGVFSFSDDLFEFSQNAQIEIERKKNTQGLQLDDRASAYNIIRYSSLPWIEFTDLKHAWSSRRNSGEPSVSVGKYCKIGSTVRIPFSLTVHHGLMDGIHVSKFFNALNQPY